MIGLAWHEELFEYQNCFDWFSEKFTWDPVLNIERKFSDPIRKDRKVSRKPRQKNEQTKKNEKNEKMRGQ